VSSLPKTGDAALDFATEAGPRVLSPDTPEYVLKEIGHYKYFSPLREAMRKMKLAAREKVVAAIMRTYQENQIIAQFPPARRSLYPDSRIPIDLVYELEAQEKEIWSPAMREDTLKCYPGLRIDFWRK
jgi:hypothetical protein